MRRERCRLLLLILGLLPGAAAAVLLPRRGPPASFGLPLWWCVALALPLVLLPGALALTRLQRHQSRAASGLGAGPLDRLRWLWLPQLGPGIALSLLLAMLFAGAVLLRP